MGQVCSSFSISCMYDQGKIWAFLRWAIDGHALFAFATPHPFPPFFLCFFFFFFFHFKRSLMDELRS